MGRWQNNTKSACLFLSVGVRCKPRMYCSLLAYCIARFGISTLATTCPRAYRRVPHSSGGSWNLWAENKDREFCLSADFHGRLRDLLHATNLRHGTHGFTSLPKEGVLRIFPTLNFKNFQFWPYSKYLFVSNYSENRQLLFPKTELPDCVCDLTSLVHCYV
jgi:hypothetical protein